MTDPNLLYGELKFWLPLLTFSGLIVKAYLNFRKSTTEWMNQLLDNHLTHIQKATQTTSDGIAGLANAFNSHEEKEMKVWEGVVRTLDVLEDRTARRSRARRKK